MKAKGPVAAAKADEDKKKGLALFGAKSPTPKLYRAFRMMDKLKVTLTFLATWSSDDQSVVQMIQKHLSGSSYCIFPFFSSSPEHHLTGNEGRIFVLYFNCLIFVAVCEVHLQTFLLYICIYMYIYIYTYIYFSVWWGGQVLINETLNIDVMKHERMKH